MAAPPAFDVVPSSHPSAFSFYEKTVQVIDKVKETNPQYKQAAGNLIFEFVAECAGLNYAPKITGMIIDLPVHDIRY